ncbi:hypothetical protein BCR36DRAFT_413592 [Piromyces finnis]|uniref:SAP domain-containing protein n=1 Tax=Piromyces finnis TaxID=1754191 RepID=A0A1Y1V5D6_9FUNG|nr:hypothetical protein BCR36DRAFT_413592 [Piromyces finnis]|eukprot:ORX47652.1 hypothetical protein BCR36DRAFT_413592 [Piromyces finnis]
MQTQVNNLLQLPFHHLKVADLRDILRSLGLKRSGNKDTLIENLKLYLRKIGQTSDIHSLTVVSQLLYRYLNKNTTIVEGITKTIDNIDKRKNKQLITQNQQPKDIYKDIVFVKTPFIKHIQTLYCGEVPHSLLIRFVLNEEQSYLFQNKNNDKYKILLYCASQHSAEESLKNKTDCPIQYPCNPVLRINELTVNGMDEVTRKHNKAWTTKPVDITHYCRKKKESNMNEIRFLSEFISSKWKDFVVKIIICEYITLQEAVNNIKKNYLSKEEILRQRLNLKKGSDDEIETTSSIVSLRCPISRARIKTPCRFKECTHVQCFDLTSYLQLNEKSPNWKCPVCNIRYTWKSLVMDGYIQDILNNVSMNVDSIVVEVNGTWHIDQTLEENLIIDEEIDEEEDLYFKKLEEEMKAGGSIIDLTSDDEVKTSQNSTHNSSIVSIISSPTPSTSQPITSISIPNHSVTPPSSSTGLPLNRKRTMGDLIAPRRKKVNGKSNSTSSNIITIDNTNRTVTPHIRPKILLSDSISQSSSTPISDVVKSTSKVMDISDVTDLTNLSNLSNITNLQDLTSLIDNSDPSKINGLISNIINLNNSSDLSNMNISNLSTASSLPTTTKGKKNVDLLPKTTKSNPYLVGLSNLTGLSQNLSSSQLALSLSQDMNYDVIVSSVNDANTSSSTSNSSSHQPTLTAQIQTTLPGKANNTSADAVSNLSVLNASTNLNTNIALNKADPKVKINIKPADLSETLDKTSNTNITGLSTSNLISSLANPTTSSNSILDFHSLTNSPLSNLSTLPISSSINPSTITSDNLGVQPGSLDLFSSNSLLSNLTSSPSVLKSKSSITIPASISSISNNSSIKKSKSYSSPILLPQRRKDEEILRPNLLKSALLNHSIAPASAKSSSITSPFFSATTPKVKSLSLNNSPRMSPRMNSPRINSRPTSLSAQSSPILGVNRTPTKYKNITPKPVKTTSSFDFNTLSQLGSFNQYLSLLSSMNRTRSNNPVSSATLTNPFINSLLPFGTPPDPSSLLYYQSLNSLASRDSLLNTNLSQLATPPPIPSLCDPSILSALQTAQSTSSNSNVASSLNPYLGSDLTNPFALALVTSIAPTTTSSASKTLPEATSKINMTATTTSVDEIPKSLSTPLLSSDLMDTDTSAILSDSFNVSNNDNNKHPSDTNINDISTDANALLNSLNAGLSSSSSITNSISSLNIPISLDGEKNNISSATKINNISISKESTLPTTLSASSAMADTNVGTASSTVPIINTNTASADLMQNLNMNLYLNQLFDMSGLSTTSTPDPNLYSLMMANPAMTNALATSTDITSQLNLLNTLRSSGTVNPLPSTTTTTTKSTTSNTTTDSSSNQTKSSPNLSIPFVNLPFL